MIERRSPEFFKSPGYATGFDRFMEDVVVNTLGVQTTFERFERALEDRAESQDVFKALFVMTVLLRYPAVHRYYEERKTFHRCVKFLGRCSRPGKLDADDRITANDEWDSVNILFKYAHTDQCDGCIIADLLF